MADVTVIAGAPANPRQNVFRSNNVQNGISVDPGNGVVLLDELAFSKADADDTANCAGIAVTAGEFPGSVDVQYAGPCTLTTDQWDAVTGETGGLTAHAVYYVSQATAGHLTKTAPVSGRKTVVGFALSKTTMMLQISPFIVLS